jgi:predicted HAD superfamily Cof-like phosphohydrolase
MFLLDTMTSKILHLFWLPTVIMSSFITEFIVMFMPYSVSDFLFSYNIKSNFSIEKRDTDFDKVLEFNRLFNVPQISKSNTVEENDSVIKNGFALITEEFEELSEAVGELEKDKELKTHIDRIHMTSNTKLGQIANNFLYVNNIYNPTFDIYRIIMVNTYITKSRYVSKYGNVNKYMSDNVKLSIDEQFDDITQYKLELFNNLNALSYIQQSINTVKHYVDNYSLKSSKYTIAFMEISLVDLLIKVYELGELQFDFKENFNIVHQSNMSKICSSEEEAKETVASYEKKYKDGNSPYDSPYYQRITSDKWMVRNRSTQKVLKNINYHPVEYYPGWVEFSDDVVDTSLDE